MNFADFHFLRPYWLIAIVPLALLVWTLARQKLRDQGWKSICDPALLPHILIRQPTRRRSLGLHVLSLAGLLSIAALAGPTWERLPEPVFRDQSGLVIALDLSRSMDATDVKPSRLSRARFKVADILKQRKEGLTAFVVYAADAFTVTPMTDDTATIASQLPALSTALMPVQGSRAELALAESGRLLRQSGFTRGDVLLITDAVKKTAAVEEAIRGLKEQGYRVSFLGIGTAEGSPIPLQKGGFVKDKRDAIVIAKLDEAALQALADIGGGIYTGLRLDDQDIQALQAFYSVDRLQDGAKATRLKADIWREQGPWLLLGVLPLAALAFRRGYLMLLALVLLPSLQPASAMDWAGLWLRPDQQASRALHGGEARRAAELFNDPAWKAAAWYRAGDYAQALHYLAGAQDSESLYNKGNALARLGRFAEAIEAYDEALAANPDHEDARYNRELLEKELQRQRREQQQSHADQQHRQGAQDQEQNGQSQNSPQHRESSSAQRRQQAHDQTPRRDDSEDASPAHVPPPRPAPQTKRDQAQADAEPPKAQIDTPAEPMDESELATEQWLRRIPDDPGGLLRRKFRYLHQRRSRSANQDPEPW